MSLESSLSLRGRLKGFNGVLRPMRGRTRLKQRKGLAIDAGLTCEEMLLLSRGCSDGLAGGEADSVHAKLSHATLTQAVLSGVPWLWQSPTLAPTWSQLLGGSKSKCLFRDGRT